MSVDTVFKEVGSKYGYDSVTAQFEEFQDVKVRWQRSYRWAEFKVTDYLKDAPDTVLSALADGIFARIKGEDAPYPREVQEYIISKEFRDKYLDTFLSREEAFEDGPKNLDMMFADLQNKGFIPADTDVCVRWTSGPSKTSVIFHTILISTDTDGLSDEQLEYLVYRQYVKIAVTSQLPFDPSADRSTEIDDIVSKYPNADALKEQIEAICN